MSDLGEMQYFLGMQIQQTTEGISICQAKYIEDMLKRFIMQNCKPVSTPLVVGSKLMKDDESSICDATLYRSLIGMYLTSTRPDIMFVVSLVAWFMHQLYESHWRETKIILIYVSGTNFFGLFYNATNNYNVVAYKKTWKVSWMIKRVLLDMIFSLEESLFLGEENKNPLLLYLPLNKSILQLHQQVHNLFGWKYYFKTWE